MQLGPLARGLFRGLDFNCHVSTIFARAGTSGHLGRDKMKLMSATATVSVEDYLRRTEKPYCEYVDGVLYPKAMPTKLHGLIQFMLQALLRRQRVEAVGEVQVRISSTQFLIPDVIAAPVIQSPYPTEPVLLCVEILSPEDRVGAML